MIVTVTQDIVCLLCNLQYFELSTDCSDRTLRYPKNDELKHSKVK